MLSAQSPKLIAVCSGKSPSHSALDELEAVYVYGVLSQLTRFAEIQYKDLATLNNRERIILETGLYDEESRHRLHQVCQSGRAQYALVTMLKEPQDFLPGNPDAPLEEEVQVCFWLYDSFSNAYVVDEATCLPVSLPYVENESGPVVPVSVQNLNQLINQTTTSLLRAMFGDTRAITEITTPFSTSIEAMQLILQAHQANESCEKLPLYLAALQKDTLLETAYYHLARIYKQEQQYELCVKNYRQTLQVSHSSPRNKAYYATDAGIACALMGRLDYAMQWWLRALDYDPLYINPYFNIANTYEDQDNYEEAEKYFLQAQHLAPDDFRTSFNLARVYSKIGLWDKALTQYHRQLQTEDGDPWCHSDVATCYLNLGDMIQAKLHLEKTVALDPDGEAGQYAQLILSGIG